MPLLSQEEIRERNRLYKRRQREKRLKTGHCAVTAETLDQAALDALAAIIGAGDPRGAVREVLTVAATGFADASLAYVHLHRRLKSRTRKVVAATAVAPRPTKGANTRGP
jgi:hypothetical protein